MRVPKVHMKHCQVTSVPMQGLIFLPVALNPWCMAQQVKPGCEGTVYATMLMLPMPFLPAAPVVSMSIQDQPWPRPEENVRSPTLAIVVAVLVRGSKRRMRAYPCSMMTTLPVVVGVVTTKGCNNGMFQLHCNGGRSLVGRGVCTRHVMCTAAVRANCMP